MLEPLSPNFPGSWIVSRAAGTQTSTPVWDTSIENVSLTCVALPTSVIVFYKLLVKLAYLNWTEVLKYGGRRGEGSL